MLSLDDINALEEDFRTLTAHLRGPAGLTAGRSDPFYYFVYPPELTPEVQRRLPGWIGRLRSEGLTVDRVSFSDLIWDLVDASGRWEGWLEAEPDAEPEEINEAIRSVVGGPDGLIARVAAVVADPRPDTVVFFTETEMLHPFFRVRVFESALHDRIRVPAVIFYPGRRAGQFGLRFLGFYPEDGNYRATLIGGLP